MASIPDCTLVTACYVFTSYHAKSRNVEETLQTMDALLAIPCYLVIYCNQELEQPLLQQRSTMLHLTKIPIRSKPVVLDGSMRIWVEMGPRFPVLIPTTCFYEFLIKSTIGFIFNCLMWSIRNTNNPKINESITYIIVGSHVDVYLPQVPNSGSESCLASKN